MTDDVIYYCRRQVADLKRYVQTQFVLGQIAAYRDIIKIFTEEEFNENA